MCKININQELNGIELSFESKPEAATLDEIKKQGFRWNRNKKIWYAKQTADRLTFAKSLGEIEETPEKTAGKINLEDLGSNFCGHYGGAELTKAIREDLKRRGVKAVYPGTYAQYSGYYIEINNKKYFIRDNKDILIYKGIKPRLPESVTTERINNNMVQVLTVFDGIWERVLEHYKDEEPLVDTIQR